MAEIEPSIYFNSCVSVFSRAVISDRKAGASILMASQACICGKNSNGTFTISPLTTPNSKSLPLKQTHLDRVSVGVADIIARGIIPISALKADQPAE